MKYLKIPMERVGVIIGHNGETKKNLEKRSGIDFDVDSETGEVAIHEENVEDPLSLLKIETIIKAIARGFSPEHASRLFSDEYDLYIFDIHDYVGKKDSHIRRLKSRVIGREGKTKRVLEELTDSDISIYGHTISLITDINHIDIVKRSIDMLLEGSKHATVYRFIEREMKKRRLEDKFGF